ncbi:MAG: LL-diaminopimelate aminotransferase [Spirochaetales bacterium]|jgi:LL-diaminopimelate aminotransferase|nr:LL-diaminopimelate aminotransferase [Spirochaetales bacterium]
MIRINKHYQKLKASYLFSDIAGRVKAYQEAHPDQELIKLGIGDVTLPLCPACIRAFEEGVREMGQEESFRGYGPEQGYLFLQKAIAAGDYASRGVSIDPEEIFISDGAKCDTGNFQELFSQDITVAVPDPVYTVYVDTNVMAGRTGEWKNGVYENLIYLSSGSQTAFLPPLPRQRADLIYLCFPNNPTGAVAGRDELTKWVAYAQENRSLILFDGCYESYITDDALPHSIFEIPGAKEVAVELRSFSKTAGFTGTRCAFTVVPRECRAFNEAGGEVKLHPLWNRRQSTKFNGVSYPVQRAAEAIYTPEGQKQVREQVAYYLANAALIRSALTDLGLETFGGVHSPYIWVNVKRDSWEFFDELLARAQVVCTPGSGFGPGGAGYIRISAFNSRANVEKALSRLSALRLAP